MSRLKLNFKPFIFAALAVFLMVSLQLTHTQIQLARPEFKPDVFEQIKPKLEQKTNDFHIKGSPFKIQQVSAAQGYDQASAFGLIDFDSGDVILEKNLSQRLPIASLTKIMTAVVTIDLVSGEEKFDISEKAANVEPTRMGVIPGQKWTRDELLTGLLMTSANDTAQALKEGIDNKYGDGTFVKAMNEKAKFLGLKNTSFANPQGFDNSSNFSTVEDLTMLAKYAMSNYPQIAQIVGKDYQFIPANGYHKQADLYNWNGLLGVYPGVSGIKIGNTDAAGICTVVFSERAGKKVLAVVLGAPGVLQRDLWAAQLLDAGFNKLANLEPVNVTETQLKEKYSSWKYFN